MQGAAPAAGEAHQRRRVAAPVDEHQALLAAREACARGPRTSAWDSPSRRRLRARVDAADRRQRRARDATAAASRRVAAGTARWHSSPATGVAEPSTTGTCAALGPQHRQVASGVAQPVLLLERGIVLLVHDDQAQLGQRREHREARADHDPRPPASAARQRRRRSPSARLLCSAASGTSGKRARKRPIELRREVDLRHQQQRLSPARQHLGDHREVDLGLAAAGHAAQQEGCETAERVAAIARTALRLVRRQRGPGTAPGSTAGTCVDSARGACSRSIQPHPLEIDQCARRCRCKRPQRSRSRLFGATRAPRATRRSDGARGGSCGRSNSAPRSGQRCSPVAAGARRATAPGATAAAGHPSPPDRRDSGSSRLLKRSSSRTSAASAARR